jgi:hypothetical protein
MVIDKFVVGLWLLVAAGCNALVALMSLSLINLSTYIASLSLINRLDQSNCKKYPPQIATESFSIVPYRKNVLPSYL